MKRLHGILLLIHKPCPWSKYLVKYQHALFAVF